MLALSIRQPYAELILRGVPPRRICDKTIEYRSRPTRRIGERFYIYASKSGGRFSVVGAGTTVIRRCRLWRTCLVV